MSDAPIVVLGGTGKTGRRVAALLARQGRPVRAASRSAPTRFDWYDDRTWAPLLAGAEAVYLVDSGGPDAAARLADLCAQAVAAGVHRLVLLSSRDWGLSGDPERLACERAVEAAGVDWTILRPTWFGQNFSEAPLLRDPVLDGELVLPTGDGLEPFVDADDIAEVAVTVLTGPGHAGRTYDLSGPRLLSFGAAVREIAEATGREVRYRPVSGAEYVARLAGTDVPADEVQILDLLFGWIAQGRNAHLSDGVRQVLGREPRDFADYVRATAPTGIWNPDRRG
ncbi:NAD(P)H-binding protein [Plantactinospora endophytica]|uniref:NmrA family transcriptional regulator n=1 Tax=Plantactinospora endophytica TaxID=673535 RepID=A0ABQ4EA69_9ACTN|nr:NAD(P)H-binding protein [Plantactinospora endophytica]GIG91628.1 NmrA family transcriptional regulator [Plantactinospora endophytica]